MSDGMQAEADGAKNHALPLQLSTELEQGNVISAVVLGCLLQCPEQLKFRQNQKRCCCRELNAQNSKLLDARGYYVAPTVLSNLLGSQPVAIDEVYSTNISFRFSNAGRVKLQLNCAIRSQGRFFVCCPRPYNSTAWKEEIFGPVLAIRLDVNLVSMESHDPILPTWVPTIRSFSTEEEVPKRLDGMSNNSSFKKYVPRNRIFNQIHPNSILFMMELVGSLLKYHPFLEEEGLWRPAQTPNVPEFLWISHLIWWYINANEHSSVLCLYHLYLRTARLSAWQTTPLTAWPMLWGTRGHELELNYRQVLLQHMEDTTCNLM